MFTSRLFRLAGLKGGDIEEAFIGNVISAAMGQAPARQAVLGAGIVMSAFCLCAVYQDLLPHWLSVSRHASVGR